jgi:hypothetical protein
MGMNAGANPIRTIPANGHDCGEAGRQPEGRR